MTALLQVKNVSKVFGGLRANWDVSFDVAQGSILGLIGPNGAGKTTLFNCLTGFMPPTSGAVLFDGKPIHGLEPDAICRLGMVRTWQKVRPLAGLSVLDNVVVGALVRTKTVDEARVLARESLRMVRLEDRERMLAGGLPIGERKKLEVARVLATRPRLVLLDEVMGGLNAAESEDLIGLLLRIREAGLTQVVIEHDLQAIMRISDRIVVLSSGEKLAEGAPKEGVANPAVIEASLGQGYGDVDAAGH